MTTTGKPSNNIMITSIDKIPLRTTGTPITDDMTNDETVRDVLSEFEKELSLSETPANNNYQINYQQQQQQQQQIPQQLLQQQQQQLLQQQQQLPQQMPQQRNNKKKDFHIDNELVIKVFIICIIVALITNPYIYATILSKIPDNLSSMFDNYNYYIKLGLIFVILYVMMFYNVV
jgi:hypothetical protein